MWLHLWPAVCCMWCGWDLILAGLTKYHLRNAHAQILIHPRSIRHLNSLVPTKSWKTIYDANRGNQRLDELDFIRRNILRKRQGEHASVEIFPRSKKTCDHRYLTHWAPSSNYHCTRIQGQWPSWLGYSQESLMEDNPLMDPTRVRRSLYLRFSRFRKFQNILGPRLCRQLTY